MVAVEESCWNILLLSQNSKCGSKTVGYCIFELGKQVRWSNEYDWDRVHLSTEQDYHLNWDEWCACGLSGMRVRI